MVSQLFTETPDCPTILGEKKSGYCLTIDDKWRGVEVSSHKGVCGHAPPGSFEMLKL